MIDFEETKRIKAKQLRFRKAIVKDLNLEAIKEELYDISCECDNVQYYFDSEDDTLLNALDGNEDEEYEFKIMFTELCAECERMQEDLDNQYVPECFDDFFVAIGAGEQSGLLGFDTYEHDYFGIELSDSLAETESKKRLLRLTKEQLVESAKICFKILHSYLGIRHRYDCLKSAMDILKDENTGYLQVVRRIEEVYQKANNDGFDERKQSTKELDRLIKNIPAAAWIQ